MEDEGIGPNVYAHTADPVDMGRTSYRLDVLSKGTGYQLYVCYAGSSIYNSFIYGHKISGK